MLVCGLVLATVLGLGMTSGALAMPVQFFYVPLPEDQLLTFFTAVENGGAGSPPAEPITSYVTITAVANDTIIYYDQWENGYDIDIANTLDIYSAANPDGTQIWGDGNTANGAPPGIPSDIIDSGALINLSNTVVTTTRQSVIDFDGGDKIATTKTIALTRTSWAAVTLTLFAGCVEVFDTNNWGTDYRAPVGTNLADGTDYQMFEYTALSIMAGEDNTTVQIDTAGDGTFETSLTLNEGESTYVPGVSAGGHVVSSRPVQVDMLTGDIASNYESRDSALIPTNLWADRYYTPVSTPNVASNGGDERTTVWLYNPGTSAVTVTYQRRNTSGVRITSTVSVPAGGVAKQVLENATNGTGSCFYSSGAPFYAFSTTDSASTTYTANQAWDWGYTMIPDSMLTTEALVGLGLGRDPTSPTNPTENGNPIWVTTVGNGDTPATVYVDYDADPTTGLYTDPSGNGYDDSYSLRELEQARIYVRGLELDATSSGTTGDGAAAAALDITHVTGSLANRLMLVSVAIGNDATTQHSVQSVTYGGTALTLVGTVLGPAGGAGSPLSRPQVEIWALANPASGSATVQVTLTGARSFVVGVTTFRGVDISDGLTSALGTFASASGATGTTQTVGVTTTVGQVVYDAVGAVNLLRDNGTDPSTFTEGAGQTEQWTQFGRSEDGTRDRHVRAAGSIETAAGTSTTMSWTTTTDYPWAMGAVPINPVSGKIDQTGMLVYTLNTSVKLAVAWGQDPQTSAAGAPGLDVGTSVPPMPEFTAGKDGLLYDDDGNPANGYSGDQDGDGHISPGDEIVWPITVYNVSRVPVPDVVVSDAIPVDTTYVPNSTYLDGTTSIPDSGSTAFPLDEGGYYYGNLPVGGSFTLTFRVTIDAFADLVPGTLAIYNDGVARALGWDDPVDDRVFLRGRISDFVWYDSNGDGIQNAGEAGIAGVTVTLLDGDGNVVYTDQGEPITTVTDDTGLYDFTGLLPGSYVVEFLPPEGTLLTLQGQGGDGTKDSNADPSTNQSGVVTISGGQHDPSVDAGIILEEPTQAVVSFLDAYVADGKVVVGWQTLSEVGTAGYILQRLAGESDEWITVNRKLVPALLESQSGGSYCVVDETARPGEPLTYRLLEVEIWGTQRTYGPYQVVAEEGLPPGEASAAISQGEETVRVPKIAKRTTVWAPGPPSGSVVSSTSVPDRLRIEMTGSGLYRIEAADLVAGLGLSDTRVRELIRSKGLRLTARGVTVPYLQAADSSAIYFYGQAIDSVYTSMNVYWLLVARGTTMANAPGLGDTGSSATSFVDVLHVEQDFIDAPSLFHDREADFWLWDYLVAGDSALENEVVSVEATDAIAGVKLGVELQGITTTEEINEHHVRVILNGTVLGDTWWSGAVAHQADFVIPAGLLTPGANEVDVLALLDGGIDYSLVALDSLDLFYERSTVVVEDQLLLTATGAGPVQVDGLSSTGAWVIDLADPLAPRLVKVTESGGDAGAAWVTFGAASGGHYLVATAEGALRPQAITAVSAPTLNKAGWGAGYVVITSAGLYDAASRLAAYRAGRGLQTTVVTTAEIYDAFNYGIASPHAIQSFIAHAVSKGRPAPRYVVLVGEGSYDYKNFAGNDDSLVPPLMVDTEFGLAPSDVVLADTTGNDGAPELAIGRIPATSEAGIDDALAKIQAYESSSGAWQHSVVLAADNSDEAGNFAAYTDALAATLPGSLDISRAYLDDIGLAGTRALVLGSSPNNALLVSYLGHAGLDQWAEEGIFTKADVPSLGPGSGLPVVTAFTCLAGQYGLPGYDSLSEDLVKLAGAGAIAVWAPSAMEENEDSARLGTLFAKHLFASAPSAILGRAVQAALKDGAAGGLPVSLLYTYNLLGDPALKVKW
ncbi:MAG: hypothetical protein A2133_07000 [Actinobacteria bacterium RBG_16_64_13]|nr:MAG: hypothetical protein A2133_07000 [Actinobacteria bacterium RBG_16_64_13]